MAATLTGNEYFSAYRNIETRSQGKEYSTAKNIPFAFKTMLLFPPQAEKYPFPVSGSAIFISVSVADGKEYG